MISVLQQWPLWLTIGVVLICIEQIGLTTGWSSPILYSLQSSNSTISITSNKGSWIASVLTIVSGAFTPIAALMMYYLGRKLLLLLSVSIFLLSWILISFASTATELFIARVFAGIGIAVLNTVVYVYLAEIAPDKIRGSIGIGPNISSYFGVLWIYLFGTYPELWISSLACMLPLIFVFVFYKWLPESPYILIEKGNEEKARQELQKLRNCEDVDEEIHKIKISIGTKTTNNMFKELFFDTGHMRALFITMGILTIAPLTGGITFIYYAHIIFHKAGNVSPNIMTIIKACLQILAGIFATYVIDKIGRKPLLIISCIGSAVLMFCEGIYFYLYENKYNVDSIWWLPLLAMVFFNTFQAIGLTAIPKFYLGELFHPKVKLLAVCISETYWGFVIATAGILYQVLSDNFGNYAPFFIFAGIGILGVLFIVLCIPETKGRSFNEIQYYMQHKCYENDNNS